MRYKIGLQVQMVICDMFKYIPHVVDLSLQKQLHHIVDIAIIGKLSPE